MELILAGGKGSISVTANVVPLLTAQLCRFALQGDREQAEVIDSRLAPLNEALFLEANPIPVKWALYHRGLVENGIRLPLTPLHESCHARVVAALEAAGV